MSGEPRTYQVLCSSIGSTWAVRIPELDREASAARLSQVEAVARALVTTYGPTTAPVDFTIELMPDAISAASPQRRPPARRRSGPPWTRCTRGAGWPASCTSRASRSLTSPPPWASRPAMSSCSSTTARSRLPPAGPRPPLAPATAVAPRSSPHRSAAVAAAGTTAHGPDRGLRRGVRWRSWTAPTGRWRPRFRHEALFHRGDDALLAGTLPFIEEGLALGHAVMVAVPEPRLALVRDALGPGARGHPGRHGAAGAQPRAHHPALQQFIDKEGRHGRALRGVSEAVWPGRHPADRTSAGCTRACSTWPSTRDPPVLRCPYDVPGWTPQARCAEANHPWLVEDRARAEPHLPGPASGSVALGRDLPPLP